LLLTTHIDAQIDIKSKVDAQTYSNYSKAIDLLQANINTNSIITLFVPSNEGLERYDPQTIDAVFVKKTQMKF